MSSIAVQELPAKLEEALAELKKGGTIVLTSDGKDVARLSPIDVAESVRTLPPLVTLSGGGPSVVDLVLQDRAEGW